MASAGDDQGLRPWIPKVREQRADAGQRHQHFLIFGLTDLDQHLTRPRVVIKWSRDLRLGQECMTRYLEGEATDAKKHVLCRVCEVSFPVLLRACELAPGTSPYAT